MGSHHARQLDENDIVRLLTERHARIRDLCAAMAVAMSDDQKSMIVDELSELLATYEGAEEAVLRPLQCVTLDDVLLERSDGEEKTAEGTVRGLRDVPVDSADFDQRFAALAEALIRHTEAEDEQCARLLETCDPEERIRWGLRLQEAERLASSQPSKPD